MRRILIHIPVERYGEYDIFTEHNNDMFVQHIKKNGGICPNVGNRLWFQGIISEIQSADNQINYWTPSMTKEYINESYDLIVAPMANVFSVHYISLQETLAERFRGIKIPVYVIACGIQASNYDEIDEICKVLKKPASDFISSVYDTGGEFALRGYFTKEFFDRLGFDSAVVTGCPSLYQLGSDLKINTEKVEKEAFVPLFNGTPINYKEYMDEYPKAVFFDQDVFWQEILDISFFENKIEANKTIEGLIKKWGFDTVKYLLEDRIKLLADMNTWREYIRNCQFSCSFGSRIHGSIMPILSGIPAILECRDARTREMAEFFNIPFVYPERESNSLYQLYMDVDYSKFNVNFKKHYECYESFLKKCNIIDVVNTNNKFFYDKTIIDTNNNFKDKEELLYSLMDKKIYWSTYSKLLEIKRKITSLING